MEKFIDPLLENSKSAIFAAIEIHNKPLFPYRYEVCVILTINSWELLLKAFIFKYHNDVRVLNEDGTTKPFEECLRFVSGQLGNGFSTTKESIDRLYEYRCNTIHFYEDRVDEVLYSLLSKNVILYHEFLLTYFGVDIAQEANLVLLPIGFKKPISPINFLSSESDLSKSSPAIQQFIKSIVTSTNALHESGIEDSILITYSMSLINENRTKNADLIAAITSKGEASLSVENVIGKFAISSDENAKKVKIEEQSLYDTIYTEEHSDVIQKSKKIFADFKASPTFYKILKTAKADEKLFKLRFLDAHKNRGAAKGYYTNLIYEELGKHFTKVEGKDN